MNSRYLASISEPAQLLSDVSSIIRSLCSELLVHSLPAVEALRTKFTGDFFVLLSSESTLKLILPLRGFRLAEAEVGLAMSTSSDKPPPTPTPLSLPVWCIACWMTTPVLPAALLIGPRRTEDEALDGTSSSSTDKSKPDPTAFDRHPTLPTSSMPLFRSSILSTLWPDRLLPFPQPINRMTFVGSIVSGLPFSLVHYHHHRYTKPSMSQCFYCELLSSHKHINSADNVSIIDLDEAMIFLLVFMIISMVWSQFRQLHSLDSKLP